MLKQLKLVIFSPIINGPMCGAGNALKVSSVYRFSLTFTSCSALLFDLSIFAWPHIYSGLCELHSHLILYLYIASQILQGK